MTKTAITITFDVDALEGYTDQALAKFWHVAQANPAPFGDAEACDVAERVGREIIRRWLMTTPFDLWNHQGRHVADRARMDVSAEVSP